MKFTQTCAAVCAASALIHIGYVTAGPLSPPAGAPAPTYKTLSEVEPRVPISLATTPGDGDSLYRIAQPGSYYLTGNITGVSGKTGIEIAANGVSVDLMGFEVVGVAGSNNGVWAEVGRLNIRVVNGVVRGWSGHGVLLSASNVRLENLVASGNGGVGLGTGNYAVVTGCAAYQNGSSGFVGSSGQTLTGCTASENGSAGFLLFQGSVATGCTATGNVSVGYSLQGWAAAENCIAENNGSAGFAGSNDVSIRNCSSFSNTGSGFSVGARSTLAGCLASWNDIHGVSCAENAKVIDCSSTLNRTHGILVSDDSTVRGNTCDSNGTVGFGAGIQVTGLSNRIEANHCSDNDNGIDVDGTKNFIIRNSVSGNGGFGYAIAAGNLFGPNIFDAAGISSSHNPHSNYEH